MGSLLEAEKSKLLSVFKTAIIPVASNLAALLGKNVELNPSEVVEVPWAELKKDASRYVNIRVQLGGDLEGYQLVLFKEKDAALMASLMIGEAGGKAPETLDDLYFSAASEILGQMMDSLVTSLSMTTSRKITSSAPDIRKITLDSESNAMSRLVGGSEAVKMGINFSVEGFADSNIYLILSAAMAKELATSSTVATQAMEAQAGMSKVGVNTSSFQETSAPVVQPVQMPPLLNKTLGSKESNIDLLMDVSLLVSVELGRTHKYVKEVLSLGSGSVIQLDKLAGEPVDVLVNEKLIAKGEVVVINENFGVRITEIISPQERIEHL